MTGKPPRRRPGCAGRARSCGRCAEHLCGCLEVQLVVVVVPCHLTSPSGVTLVTARARHIAVARVESEQFGVGSFGPMRPSSEQHDSVGQGDRGRAGGRSRWWCGRPSPRRGRRGSRAPWSGSTAEVASSRMRTRGSARMARAMAIRWRCPPESENPRSPITVS